MFDSQWHGKIVSLLETNSSFEKLWDVLVEMKEKGISQDQAYVYFKELRNQAIIEKNEIHEDRILEVMDIISGFCRPESRIW